MPTVRLTRLFAKLRNSRRGNVLMIFAFAMIPMVFATGMGVDYTRAARLQTKMNAIADAAALAAVTQPMMLQDDETAGRTAYNMFKVQSAILGNDLIFTPSAFKLTDNCATNSGGQSLCIQITPVYNASSPGRIATVTYHAESRNAFGGILGKRTIAIAGSSTARADKAPYINFYLLLDTSPSMLLPSTSNGLTTMRNITGCAFACHLSDPHSEGIYIQDNKKKNIWLDSNGNPYSVDKVSNGYVYATNSSGKSVAIAKESSGMYADSYWLAHNNLSYNGKPNIEMRIDAEQQAVQELVPIAKEIADENKVMYRMGVYRFDYYGPNTSNYGQVAALTDLNSDANVQSVVTKSTNLPMTLWYRNSWITSSKNIDDQSTDFKTAFDQMNKIMPDPGTGQTKDDPQEVMFIITDGMSDENLSGMGRTHRELQPTHIDQCTAIKKRNIRIAILYTEYLPGSLTGNAWSQTNVAPYLPNVEPALQQCASPGLYQKVSTDDSIPDALNALFRQAVASAHLTQ
ncbi:MAG: TadE/TadG family type IV pilus assembly protein [Mesorhizobium sp.]